MSKNSAIKQTYEDTHLLSDLQKTRNALESAYSVFQNVTDPDLIDCSIYEINAIQLRYKYLLERAKYCNKKQQPALLKAGTLSSHLSDRRT